MARLLGRFSNTLKSLSVRSKLCFDVSVRTANALSRVITPGETYWLDPNVLSGSTDKELKKLKDIGDGAVKQIRNYLLRIEGRKREGWQRFE